MSLRQVLGREAHYRVVISNGSGVEAVTEFVPDENCTEDNNCNCTGDSCIYTFSSDTITSSYSVDVEILSCVTERTNIMNISVCKYKVFLYVISSPTNSL